MCKHGVVGSLTTGNIKTRVCFDRSVPLNYVHVITDQTDLQELDRAIPGPEAIIHAINYNMYAVSYGADWCCRDTGRMPKVKPRYL